MSFCDIDDAIPQQPQYAWGNTFSVPVGFNTARGIFSWESAQAKHPPHPMTLFISCLSSEAANVVYTEKSNSMLIRDHLPTCDLRLAWGNGAAAHTIATALGNGVQVNAQFECFGIMNLPAANFYNVTLVPQRGAVTVARELSISLQPGHATEAGPYSTSPLTTLAANAASQVQRGMWATHYRVFTARSAGAAGTFFPPAMELVEANAGGTAVAHYRILPGESWPRPGVYDWIKLHPDTQTIEARNVDAGAFSVNISIQQRVVW